MPEPQVRVPWLLILICVPFYSLKLAIAQLVMWLLLHQRNLLRKRVCARFSAASEARAHTLRSCDFESLFARETRPCTEELSPILFHRVAELWAEAQQRCHAAAEAGKLPSAALPNCRHSSATCADAQLRCAAPFNTNLPRLVGTLSAKRSLSMSFDEAAKAKSLLKGMMDSQSFAFWLLSTLLHWLKELASRLSFIRTAYSKPVFVFG